MNGEELVKNICLYLEILVSENEAEMPWALRTQSKEEAFLCSVEENMIIVLTEASKHDSIKSILNNYIRHPADVVANGERYWNFTLLCIILVKGLNEALMSLKQQMMAFAGDIESTSIPTLSVKQQNIVKKSLQFIIALGIFPNLIPSVRNVIRQRTEACSVVENFDYDSTVQEKYCRLLTCLMAILDCLNQHCLQSILLSHFSGDILVALFQICHAPIRKVDGYREAYEDMITENNTASPEAVKANIKEYSERYQNFSWLMTRLRSCNAESEAEFILAMWKDRPYFSDCLGHYLTLLHPSALMWQLLLIQGANIRNPRASHNRVPKWLLEVSSQMLTERLLEPDGVKTFVQVSFDMMSDADIEAGVVTRERIEAVSKIISYNPVNHSPLEFYMKDIIDQLQVLLHLKATPMSQIFSSVASHVLVQFADRNFDMAEEFISLSLLNTFWYCLSSNVKEQVFNNQKVASEESISICIEDAYEIFIAHQTVLSENAMKLIQPFFHLLFVMYTKLQNSVSYLKTKVFDLLLVILNGHTTEEAVKFLRAAAFEDVRGSDIHLVPNLKCVLGDCGGIEIIKCTEKSEEDIAENIEARCQAIQQLLQRIADRKVETVFFMLLLKKSTNPLNDDGFEFVEKDEVGLFIDNLTAIRLLESLGENIGPELFSDIDEAIELIRAALECGINADLNGAGPPFSEETMLSFLVILSTLLGYKDELTSSQWQCLKKCLKPLEKLVITTNQALLKEMAENICTAIRTHGAVLSNVTKQPKPFAHQSRLSSKKLSEKIKDIQNETQGRKSIEPLSLIEEVRSLVLDEANASSLEPPTPPPAFSDSRWSAAAPFLPGGASNLSLYHRAMLEAQDPSIPVRGHGLISLYKLVEVKDEEVLFHKEEVFKTFQKNLHDDDSYIYLPAIQGLKALGDLDPDLVLPLLLSQFTCRTDKLTYTLKIGEALLKTCQVLGDFTPKYRDDLLKTYLNGVHHQDAQIRVSSLSNLGEVCKYLKYSIGPMIQEILMCVISVVKTDPVIEVRCAAILVIVLLLQGTGKDTFTILENEIKDLYTLLRYIYKTEKDGALKLQAQLALEELNHIVKEALQQSSPLVKEIRVLDPF